MAWGPTIYAQLADAAAVADMATKLGIEVLPDGSLSTGNANFALAPMQAPWETAPVFDGQGELVTPGVLMPGIWFMGRLNDNWAGADAAMAALQDAGVLRDLADPPMRWA